MHNVWILSRGRIDSADACKLVLGVYSTPETARVAACDGEGLPLTAWQSPHLNPNIWESIRAPYIYTIAAHPEHGCTPLLFTTDLSLSYCGWEPGAGT